MRLWVKCLCVGALLWTLGAPMAWAQPGTLEADNFFEGSMLYKIDVTGEHGQFVYNMNALTNMQQHFHRNGSFIVQLWGDVNNQPTRGMYDPDNPQQTVPGYFPTTRLFLADSNWTYQLNMEQFVAFRYEKYSPSENLIPTAIFTGKTETVNKIPCFEFKVDKRDETIYYYVSPKYRVDLIRYQKLTKARANFLTKGLQGCIPLKTVRISKTKDMKTTITVYKIEAKQYDPSMFRLPANIEMRGRDYSR